ncbi:MAG: hypothetical protein QXX77_04570 [Candidatus Methanosuratincola sp.]
MIEYPKCKWMRNIAELIVDGLAPPNIEDNSHPDAGYWDENAMYEFLEKKGFSAKQIERTINYLLKRRVIRYDFYLGTKMYYRRV